MTRFGRFTFLLYGVGFEVLKIIEKIISYSYVLKPINPPKYETFRITLFAYYIDIL
jgi:hypothetical protein